MASLVPRFFRPSRQGFFLFGPRGTGKTTWLHHQYPDAVTVDLLNPILFRRLSARPEGLREIVDAHPEATWFIVDEVQKVPELLDVVHALRESQPGRRFVLTGSSARKLRRSGVDLLAGRLAHRTMHPFMAGELGPAFDLREALVHGLVPLVVRAEEPAETIAAYVSLYLREEVQQEGLVRNVGAFSRFLEAASFSHASVLNLSSVARECEVNRKTVEGHLQILEDLLLCFRLPVFTRRARRATVTHPKLYFFDAGVYRALRPAGPLDRAAEIEGCALEGLVAQHLRAFSAYHPAAPRLYFWRTRGGSEVDFVLYGSDIFWGIEVKNASRIRAEDLRSLRTFRDEYPEARAILVYRGTERLMRDQILCLPCDEFLLGLDPRHEPDW